MDYRTQTTPERISDGTFRWKPHAAWNQGLGVYGGLTFAHMIQVVGTVSTHPIRRLSVELCAPVLERDVSISLASKRRGGKTEFFSLELLQDGDCVGLAHATCGGVRTRDLDRAPITELPQRHGNTLPDALPMPPFARFFDYEPTRGQIPASGSTDAVLESGGWLTPRFDAPRDHALVAAVIDAWWPAILGAAPQLRPMGTMSFAMDFLRPPTQEAGPFYLEVSSAHVADGYSLEMNELWDHHGHLLARAQQNIAIIR